MSSNPWVWIAAVLTLCIYSFLYRDNPFYKIAEHIVVGVSAAYFLIIYWYQSVWPDVVVPVFAQGRVLSVIPLVLGLFMFSRFIPRWGWLSRWSIAFYVGAGAGISIPAVMQARIFKQMEGTMAPLFSRHAWVAFTQEPSFASFTGLIAVPLMVVGVLCTLSYFFFSQEHKGALGKGAAVGIWFLMIGFGASFGYTVMARISLLIGRIQFLLSDWLGFIK